MRRTRSEEACRINRVKYVHILEILRQETDKENPMKSTVLMDILREKYGIILDRRTLYTDIKILNHSGYKVGVNRAKTNEYHVDNMDFSVAEMRVLMEAIEAANFISPEDTCKMIDKVATLGGARYKDLLAKQDWCYNTSKHKSVSIFTNIGTIFDAINANKKLKLRYCKRDAASEKVYSYEGKEFSVDPITTIFDDGNLYMVCLWAEFDKYVNLRVDRMEDVIVSEDDRTATELITKFDVYEYRQSTMRMFAGDPTTITLEVESNIAEAICDKFGDEVKFVPSNGKFNVDVEVASSPQFYAFIFGLDGRAKIVAPAAEVDKYKVYLKKALSILE